MPTITPTAFDSTGFISVSFSNPSGPVFNRLRRDGILLSSTIPIDTPDPDAAVFNDWQVRSGRQVSYIGSSMATGGQETAPTAPITATLNLQSAWIHHVGKNANSNLGTLGALELFNLEGQRQERTREGNVVRLASVEQPRILTAPQVARTIECPIVVRESERTTVMPILEAMIWSNELFCFRDCAGELMFCTFDPQESSTDLDVEMVLKLTESSYSEGI